MIEWLQNITTSLVFFIKNSLDAFEACRDFEILGSDDFTFFNAMICFKKTVIKSFAKGLNCLINLF